MQAKLQAELDSALMEADSKVASFDVIKDLPYLDAVCRETMRVFPPLSMVTRT